MNPTLLQLRTAYRECARVVLSYKEGCALDPRSELALQGQSGGIPFNEHENLYKAILLFSHQRELFDKLTAAEKKHCPYFMITLQKVASARAAGERALFTELTEQGKPTDPVRENPGHDPIDHTLLMEMKKIWKHLRAVTPPEERSSVEDTDFFVDSEVESSAALLQNVEGYQSALKALVQALLNAKNQHMTTAEVERLLGECGYINFLESQTHRSEVLIKKLDLKPHPEGGYYSEIHRSKTQVQHAGKPRTASTSIYFLLAYGQVSRWHVVDADEAWHFYEGQPLELYIMPPDFSKVEKISLGTYHRDGVKPVHVVPAGWWQASRTSDEYTLCGCTVAPGFEFSGFRMLNDAEKATVKGKFPALEFLV
ncbi:MAG TPA: cupin domain-containing protein [Bacteroidia bacterium]|nr:cupin domain-containing protein [Bacteroidia bacterium]